jgi:dynein heavy chain
VQDKDLIGSLEDAKELSRTVAEKMRVGAETQAKIQRSAERYRSVATRGALLFFAMVSLDKINAFYKFSLNAFVVVFIRGIDSLASGVAPLKKERSNKARSLLQVRAVRPSLQLRPASRCV